MAEGTDVGGMISVTDFISIGKRFRPILLACDGIALQASRLLVYACGNWRYLHPFSDVDLGTMKQRQQSSKSFAPLCETLYRVWRHAFSDRFQHGSHIPLCTA